MNNTKIEWTDRTWNPVSGCTKVSQGCKNCYAETMHERFNGKGSFRKVTIKPHKIDEPLKWKKPSKIFVNSMSDLFHEDVPFSFIYDVMVTIQKAHWHTFQILTKRPEIMVKFFNEYAQPMEPIPNLWIGVSAENQDALNERLPYLLQTKAVVKFLSCEPLLGPIVFNPEHLQQIQWVIIGGESGPKARIMEKDWVYDLVRQLSKTDIPTFFKQWGEFLPYEMYLTLSQTEVIRNFKGKSIKINDVNYLRVGKKQAGNSITGYVLQEFPNQ